MKRAAEMIHIVPEERAAYLKRYLEPTESVAKLLWDCGIRKQYYYEMKDYIIRTYKYTGTHFKEDMQKVMENPETADFFLQKRRGEVAPEDLDRTNWWAPLHWLGKSIDQNPMGADETGHEAPGYSAQTSGCMVLGEDSSYLAYDEDDWSESIHM